MKTGIIGRSVVVLGVIGMAAVTSASILTFEADGVASPNALPQSYGDRIASVGPDANGHMYAEGNGFTPNVVVSYGTVGNGVIQYYTDPYFASDDEIDAPTAYLRSDFGDPTPDTFLFTFTPDPEYGVRINSFELIDYPGYAGGHEVDWFIYKDVIDAANILASGSETLLARDLGDPIVIVNTGLSGFHYGDLILAVDHISGVRDDLALNNLNFDQFIPEPTSFALLLLGTAGLTLRRRRQGK